MPPTVITLASAQLAEATGAAFRNAKDFEGQSGAYGDNEYERHLTGSLGEEAAFEWLKSRGLEPKPLFRHTSPAVRTQADLLAGKWRIEVKTWRERSWERFGPTLAAQQLLRIAHKADVLVLMRVPDEPRPSRVEVAGWLYVQNALAAGSPTWTTKVKADLVLDQLAIAPPTRFIEQVEGLPPSWLGPLATIVGACGHLTSCGHCWVCAGEVGRAVVQFSDRGRGFFHLPDASALYGAHGDYPFGRDSLLTRLPIGEAVLSHRPCPFCFP